MFWESPLGPLDNSQRGLYMELQPCINNSSGWPRDWNKTVMASILNCTCMEAGEAQFWPYGNVAVWYSCCQPVQFIPGGREDLPYPIQGSLFHTMRIVNNNSTQLQVIKDGHLSTPVLYQCWDSVWTGRAASHLSRESPWEGQKKGTTCRLHNMGPEDQHCGSTTIVCLGKPYYRVLEIHSV